MPPTQQEPRSGWTLRPGFCAVRWPTVVDQFNGCWCCQARSGLSVTELPPGERFDFPPQDLGGPVLGSQADRVQAEHDALAPDLGTESEHGLIELDDGEAALSWSGTSGAGQFCVHLRSPPGPTGWPQALLRRAPRAVRRAATTARPGTVLLHVAGCSRDHHSHLVVVKD